MQKDTTDSFQKALMELQVRTRNHTGFFNASFFALGVLECVFLSSLEIFCRRAKHSIYVKLLSRTRKLFMILRFVHMKVGLEKIMAMSS